MSQTSRRPAVASHPAWCAPDRCGHLVPPVLAHMARRHRGVLLRVGEVRSSGLVVSYLIGSDDEPPAVVVHASCRAGAGWAELTLPQTKHLVDQLGSLLTQAAGPGEGEHGRQ
ncbi:hypothetical protein [Verrucosispora sp. WMMD573]|uniref:hypothetical protein n=1 Tax=Verrucosispora sp. WMMD573 TaxID=3015149 RepID=UPI00248C047F|nr:hypothetical protein [Verrucosispora sp. WMMD573]WBB54349.1 hypothetical protein O7601_28150 [Verrucosispora sp. WMMD573]